MDNFVYDIPTRVYFGKGEEEKVGKIISEYNVKKSWFITEAAL